MNNNFNRNNENKHSYETIKARDVNLKDDYPFFNKNFIYRAFSIFMIILYKVFLEYFYARIFLGFRVKNKKYFRSIKKNGTVIISNHIHNLDAFLIGTTSFPRRIFVTMLHTNLGLPLVGKLMRYAGAVPIPVTKNGLKNFTLGLKEEIMVKNHKVLVLPEAALMPYHKKIRPFMAGAFRFAVDTNADLLPIVFVLKKPKGIYKLFKKKPCIEMHYLEPIKNIPFDKKGDQIRYLRDTSYEVMSKYFNEHSDYTEETHEQ